MEKNKAAQEMARKSHARFAKLSKEQKTKYFRLIALKKKKEAKEYLRLMHNR